MILLLSVKKMSIFKNIITLFYPNYCLHCDKTLPKNVMILCTKCRENMQILQNMDYSKNKIYNLFYGNVKINHSLSFLSYRKKGVTRTLIQHLKYKKRQDVGTFLGNWYGNILKERDVFSDIDYMIPVPLHSQRLASRGYNQVTTFCESLSEQLKIPFLPGILKRDKFTETQTTKKKIDRFLNTATKFNLSDLDIFENKHVLLVDDVITTGATLQACCLELQKTKNINISIVTIALTESN